MQQMQALLLSLSIEGFVAIGLIYILRWNLRHRLAYLVGAVMSVTLLTHPVAWFANEQLFLMGFDFFWRALVIESIVITIEGFALSYGLSMGLNRGLVLSAAANATSFSVGLFW
jgi:hypothetical protein